MGITNNSLAGRLAAMRAESGMTQAELAEKANVSLRGLQDIEYGNIVNPRMSTLYRLAGALQVPVEELVEDDTIENGVAKEHEPSPDRLGMIEHVIGVLPSLTDYEMGAVTEFLDALLDDTGSPTVAVPPEKPKPEDEILRALRSADPNRTQFIRWILGVDQTPEVINKKIREFLAHQQAKPKARS